MTTEMTEIINCRIIGPNRFIKKAPMALEQVNKDPNIGQIVRCADCLWGTEGEYLILPKISSKASPRAVCVNFGCANNDRITAINEGYGRDKLDSMYGF